MEKEKSLSLFSEDTLDSIAMAEIMGGCTNTFCDGAFCANCANCVKGCGGGSGTQEVQTETQTETQPGTSKSAFICVGSENRFYIATVCRGSGTPANSAPALGIGTGPILTLP